MLVSDLVDAVSEHFKYIRLVEFERNSHILTVLKENHTSPRCQLCMSSNIAAFRLVTRPVSSNGFLMVNLA